MTTQIRLYVEIASAIVLLAAFALFVHHERVVGAEHISAADAKALSAAKDRDDAQTALNIERAAKADAGARSAQDAVDAYVAAHPTEPSRVCYSYSSQPVPSKGSAAVKSAPSAGTGSAPVREVQNRDAGPNIGPGIDELVLSASHLAALYADRQQR